MYINKKKNKKRKEKKEKNMEDERKNWEIETKWAVRPGAP
jgi:hypothetical protein